MLLKIMFLNVLTNSNTITVSTTMEICYSAVMDLISTF